MNPPGLAHPETTPASPEAPADSSATAAMAVERLSHHYPMSRSARRQGAAITRTALDAVSFEVQPGEIFGILGPNGGGKTTLFQILATLLRPQSQEAEPGRARIFGYDVLTQPQRVREMLGVVFQHPSIDGKLAAWENLHHQGRLHGLGGRDLRRRIDRALTHFGLADRRNERTEHFSGGLRRRVELAKALLHEPGLLMMDEPATGLDPGARHQLWDRLRDLRDGGVTTALTTHLMEEAEHCDRLAILDAGRLVAVDTPARLKARVGGDVLTLDPAPVEGSRDEARALAQRVTERFGPWEEGTAPEVVDGRVRFERADGARMVAAIAGCWPDRIQRISVGQPTLEDVFLHLTGGAFTRDT